MDKLLSNLSNPFSPTTTLHPRTNRYPLP